MAIHSLPLIGALTLAMFVGTAGAAPRLAAAQAPPPGAVRSPPSPFETGMNGFSMGLGAGLAGGYLVARDGGFSSRDWRPLAAGAGIGALAGGILGLTLSITDGASATPGRGYLIMRDMAYGGLFGAMAGGIVGGLAALKTDKPEHILLGASIGMLSGTALGVVLGSVQRNPFAPSAPTAAPPMAWNLGFAPVPTADGALSWGPILVGAF